MEDRRLRTVDFVEQTMGVLAWLLAGAQLLSVVVQIAAAPYLITWQWCVQKVFIISAAVLYGVFFVTSNKNFRPILMAYGICCLAIAFVPDAWDSMTGFTKVFGESVFTSYSLFEFLYYCKHCLIFVFVLGLGVFMIKSGGLINGRIENCSLLMMASAIVGQIYTTLYLLSNNVVLTAQYNLHIGYMATCLLIPAVYVLYCCDESFGGVPTLS